MPFRVVGQPDNDRNPSRCASVSDKNNQLDDIERGDSHAPKNHNDKIPVLSAGFRTDHQFSGSRDQEGTAKRAMVHYQSVNAPSTSILQPEKALENARGDLVFSPRRAAPTRRRSPFTSQSWITCPR